MQIKGSLEKKLQETFFVYQVEQDAQLFSRYNFFSKERN